MRLFIKLSYNGRYYSGWQTQPSQTTIQGQLERALTVWFREPIKVTGAGRTDSGVNAVNYIAHFDLSPNNPHILEEPQKILFKINAILPNDIVVYDIWQVDDNMHSRFNAISRTYKYFIHTTKAPLHNIYSYYVPYKLNIDSMNEAAGLIIGTHDFTSMSKLHSEVSSNICTVTKAIWTDKEDIISIEDCEAYQFTITADRFLRNMVRAIVGTLIIIGREKYPPIWILEVLSKKDRSAAGGSVPPHPLFLTNISYL